MGTKKYQITKEDLIKIEKSKKHRFFKESGVFDGRYREKVVISKRHKDVKHRGREFE